jgi:hypothetical protein
MNDNEKKMNDNDSLTIVRVFTEFYMPNFYGVEFNKNVDAQEFPHNEMWLRATDELDAVRQVHDAIANGEIKEVTV